MSDHVTITHGRGWIDQEAGYRVIAPDYRGAGDSSKPSAGYDKWTMAGDIHHLVHHLLGVEDPVSLVGRDLGEQPVRVRLIVRAPMAVALLRCPSRGSIGCV